MLTLFHDQKGTWIKFNLRFLNKLMEHLHPLSYPNLPFRRQFLSGSELGMRELRGETAGTADWPQPAKGWSVPYRVTLSMGEGEGMPGAVRVMAFVFPSHRYTCCNVLEPCCPADDWTPACRREGLKESLDLFCFACTRGFCFTY